MTAPRTSAGMGRAVPPVSLQEFAGQLADDVAARWRSILLATQPTDRSTLSAAIRALHRDYIVRVSPDFQRQGFPELAYMVADLASDRLAIHYAERSCR